MEKTELKLSFVVPVYNVEKYIAKCILSLLNQDYDNYEIIVVDDGSPDNSIAVLKRTILSPKVKIIQQENQGLSGARNTGIAAAKGEYIWCFDSDDWLESNVLGSICERLNDVDIMALGNYYDVNETDFFKRIVPNKINQDDVFNGEYLHCAPFYICRKQFLKKNNLFFFKGIYHEDSLFTPCALFWAQRIDRYDVPVYYRLLHEGSITHTTNPKRVIDMCFIIQEHLKFAKNNVPQELYYKWTQVVGDLVMATLNLYFQCPNMDEIEVISIFKGKNRKCIVDILCHSAKFPTKMYGWICKLTNANMIRVYNFLRKVRY